MSAAALRLTRLGYGSLMCNTSSSSAPAAFGTGLRQFGTSQHATPKGCAVCAIGGAVVGAAGLYLLSSPTFPSPGRVPVAFYNRPYELRQLEEELCGEPGAMILLNGEYSCGKTALLKHLASRGTQPILRLNLREYDTTNPLAFAQQLHNELAKANAFDGVKQFSASAKFRGFLARVGAVFEDQGRAALASVQQDLQAWLRTRPKGSHYPVIMIDEANKLKDWRQEDDTALQGFLDMLVSISKEEHLAHVVMATSDDFMAHWLERRGLKGFLIMTLGNLSEAEARGYVCGLPKHNWQPLWCRHHAAEGFTVPDELWPRIYSTCGGNMGLLYECTKSAVHAYNTDENKDVHLCWHTALQRIHQDADRFVQLGFSPKGLPVRYGQAPLWSPKHWAAVLDALIEAKHHVVPLPHLQWLLGDGDVQAGDLIVQSLLQYNMVGYRVRSVLSRDLTPEPLGKPRIVAPLPSVMEQILSRKGDSQKEE